jgi:hypothetical protein
VRRPVFVPALAVLLLAAALPAAADTEDRPLPALRVREMPRIEPSAAQRTLSPAEQARIERAIAQLRAGALADIDYLSSVLTLEAFSSIPTRETVHTLLLPDGMEPRYGVQALLALGPKALPALLACLDDQTPIGLPFESRPGFGVIRFEEKLSGNPANPLEREAMDAPPLTAASVVPLESLRRYTVTVGDLCFGALGQIAGRPYQAVRIPAFKITSPARDARLAARVRAIWASADPAGHLLRSLLRDLATVPAPDPLAVDVGPPVTSGLQAEAALRLLYYFPREAAPLVARKIRSLNFANRGDITASFAADRAVGVDAASFLEAVAWCREPHVQRAVAAVKARTANPAVLEAIEKAFAIRVSGPCGDGDGRSVRAPRAEPAPP